MVLVEPLVFHRDERRLDVRRHLGERHHGPALEAEVGDEPPVRGVHLRRLVGIVAAELGDGGTAVSGAGPRPERREHGASEGYDCEERDQNDAAGARRVPNALQQTRLPAGHAPKLAGCEARFQRVRYAPMSDLLELLAARGFVQDATPGLAERLRQGPITAYVGFDPTADSLHVGNLVPVMGMAWLQRQGHTPIALVGGGTGMVGDPSGKRSERPVLSLEQIDRNAQRLVRQLRSFLAFEGANAARIRNNADWLRTLGLMEFLRDTGKHFTISHMLQKESVQSRLETRDLVHRVQLHADPGVRLLAPVPYRRLRAADGWQRPVGQHHGRHLAGGPPRSGGRCTDWCSRSSPRRAAPSSARASPATSGSTPSGPARITSTSSG